MKEEFMSGKDDDLSRLGFVDSDDEVDFTVKKKKKDEVEEEV
jgi:hypothetical protein